MLVCYAIIVFVLVCLICFYVLYVPVIARMPLRKIQSMNSCLIYHWVALMYKYEYKLANMVRNGRIVSQLQYRKMYYTWIEMLFIIFLKFSLLFSLLLLFHWDIGSNLAPKKSSNCQPLKFSIVTAIVYCQKIVLKYISWNLSILCIAMTIYIFPKRSYALQ